MSLRQYPFLSATLGLFGVVCLTGVGLAVTYGIKYSQAHNTLVKKEKDTAALLLNKLVPVVPAPALPANATLAEKASAQTKVRHEFLRDNLADAQVNLRELNERKDALEKRLRGDEFAITPPGTAPQFVTELRAVNERLNKSLAENRVRIYRPTEFGFGFSRYLGNDASSPPPGNDEILKKLSTEKVVVEWLVSELIKAKDGEIKPQKPDQNPLIIQSVQREPIEINATTTRSFMPDEYTPSEKETLRRPDASEGYFFRLVFTARTDVLRRFVKQVRNSGHPIVLRGIAVAPAKADVLVDPAAEEAARAAAAAAANAGTLPNVTLATPAAPATPVATATPAAPAAAAALPGFATADLPALPAPAPALPTTTPTATATPSTGTAPTPAAEPTVVDNVPTEYTVSFEYLLPTKAIPPAPKPDAATTTSR